MTEMGIKANPSQLKAILESLAPSSRKEGQQLTGRLATLGQFISRFIDCLKPFSPPSRELIGSDGMKNVIGLLSRSSSI